MSPLEQCKNLVDLFPQHLYISWEGQDKREFTITLGDNTGADYGEFAITPGDQACFLVRINQELPKSFRPAYEALLKLAGQVMLNLKELS